MALNAFAVVADFRFDVAGAIVPTEKLTNQVEKLSSASEDAMNSLKGFGLQWGMQVSGLYGGVAGIIGNALKAAEKFKSTQIEIANIVNQNKFFNPDGSKANYVDGLLAAERVIDRINKKAVEINVDAGEWVEATKFFSSVLAPKDLAGQDMGQAQELARVALKGVPALGIDMNNATNQILNALTGGLSKGTMFSERLFAEAGDAIQEAFPDVKGIKEFNKLSKSDRLKAIIAGLDKLAGSADAVNDRAGLMSNQLRTIWSLFGGINSVLKPLGNVIMPLVNDLLKRATEIIDKQGRQLIERLSMFLGDFIKTPEQLFVDLSTMAKLADLVKMTGNIVGLTVGLVHLGDALDIMAKIPILKNIVGPLRSLGGFLMKLPIIGTAITSFMAIFTTGTVTTFVGMIKVVGVTLVKMAGLFSVLILPIVGFYRALQRMKIENAQWWVDNSVALADTFLKIKNAVMKMISPITTLIKGFEELFFFIFGGTAVLDGYKSSFEALASVMEFVGNMILYPLAAIKALAAGLFEFIFTTIMNWYTRFQQLMQGNFKDALMGTGTEDTLSNVVNGMSSEFKKTINAFRSPTENADGDQDTISQNTYNQYVQMTNQFKETLSPDRIAFTIRDQLEKESLFPSGGGGGAGVTFAQDGRTL